MADANTPKRRGFLTALGLAGTAAAATAHAATETASRGDSVPAGMARKEDAATRVAARYRETDHVKTFYATNRY